MTENGPGWPGDDVPKKNAKHAIASDVLHLNCLNSILVCLFYDSRSMALQLLPSFREVPDMFIFGGPLLASHVARYRQKTPAR